jgi:hypothetical protein
MKTKTLIIAALSLTAALSTYAGGKQTAATNSVTYKVASDAKIVVGENKSATLAEVKPGDHVGLAYSEVNGIKLAHHIRDLRATPDKSQKPDDKASKPIKAEANGEAKPETTLKHVRGIVESVEPQNATITLTERLRSSEDERPARRLAKKQKSS